MLIDKDVELPRRDLSSWNKLNNPETKKTSQNNASEAKTTSCYTDEGVSHHRLINFLFIYFLNETRQNF